MEHELDVNELRAKLIEFIPPRSKDRYTKLVDKLLSGTVMAAIRLKCLDCSYFQEGEVRSCNIKSCALWPFRMRKNPFRKKRKTTDKPMPPWLKEDK